MRRFSLEENQHQEDRKRQQEANMHETGGGEGRRGDVKGNPTTVVLSSEGKDVEYATYREGTGAEGGRGEEAKSKAEENQLCGGGHRGGRSQRRECSVNRKEKILYTACPAW